MILVGNQRGGAKNLALHLMKEENEHIHVQELRGFCSKKRSHHSEFPGAIRRLKWQGSMQSCSASKMKFGISSGRF